MSTLRTDTLSNSAGSASVPVNTVISGSAKAWVNFNGTGTVAIRAAFNVSSITDGGAGVYTVNFTTAMPDVNYSVSTAVSSLLTTRVADIDSSIYSTTQVGIFINQFSGGANGRVDADVVGISIFR